ncbi:MAG: hypothetical protein ACR2KV_05300 [Solirubrobacteraceae bacterium]
MSTSEPSPPTSSSWESGLNSIEDQHEAAEYAKGAVHEPLSEAHSRAKRVLELENARENPRPAVLEHAQQSVDIIAQAMGMWSRG